MGVHVRACEKNILFVKERKMFEDLKQSCFNGNLKLHATFFSKYIQERQTFLNMFGALPKQWLHREVQTFTYFITPSMPETLLIALGLNINWS